MSRFLTDSKLILPAFAAESFANMIEGMDPEAYHTTHDHVSSSGLKSITESPRHFLQKIYDYHNGEEEKEKPHLKFGKVAHMMLLEPAKFKETYVIQPDFGNMRTKSAKQDLENWLKDQKPGAVSITQEEMLTLTHMVESVMSHKKARQLFTEGVPEMSLFFSDQETKIKCRARPDFYSPKQKWLIDFKTTRNVSPGLFSYSIQDFKYHMQMAFYSKAIEACLGTPPEGCVLIAVEKEPPYDTVVYLCSDEMIERGTQRVKWALLTLKRCLETGKWPGRQQDRAEMISLPKKADFETFPEYNFD